MMSAPSSVRGESPDRCCDLKRQVRQCRRDAPAYALPGDRVDKQCDGVRGIVVGDWVVVSGIGCPFHRGCRPAEAVALAISVADRECNRCLTTTAGHGEINMSTPY